MEEERKPTRIYQCEDSIDGIFSAVYEAGLSRYGHKYIRIEPQSATNPPNIELFSEYVPVKTDSSKVTSVIRAVKNKISYEAYVHIMYAAASACLDRGDAIYQFVTYGFAVGAKICGAVQFPGVARVLAISKMVRNEYHHYREFLRFKEVQREPSLLLATIEPENRVLPMLAPHFAERMEEEWFIIYDKTHGEAVFHPAKGEWQIGVLNQEEAQGLEKLTEQREEYVELWKTFFQNIAVVERTNKNLQRNLLPLHFRKYMTEFEDFQ